MEDVKGRVAVVTGASSGIGRAVARRLAEAGCTVTITARRGDLLDELARELSASEAELLAVPADVTVEKEIKAVIDERISTKRPPTSSTRSWPSTCVGCGWLPGTPSR